MYRFLVRPRWIAFHVLVATGVAAMVSLGFWQLDRHTERQSFNDEVRSRAVRPVVPIGELVDRNVAGVDAARLEEMEWRTVSATGTYLSDEQVLIVNRSQGGVAGRNVVTPLLLADGSAVLVTRGFVALAAPVPAAPSGDVTVIGRLRTTADRSLGGLTDPPGERVEFQRLDIDRIAAQIDVDVIRMSIDLLEATPPVDTASGDPFPLPDPELASGPHLSYMVQWWIFSLCAVVGWVFAVRRSVRTRRRAATTVTTTATVTVTERDERTAADSPSPVDA
jgi:cytochrome oxidase assembly protein ShyY1